MKVNMAQPQATTKSNHLNLNGRTLEGGGQLVRIALALSTLTSRPVSIDHVRGNRQGKKGLKGSHVAAVKLLGEISDSKVSGNKIGSEFLNFFPEHQKSTNGPLVDLSQVEVQSEYNICLPTAGAIFLVFQALYPYLLHVGSKAAAPFITVTITGGTNASFSPSYDYASQVLVPNLARLGLPPLFILLHKRGWSSGPVELGSIQFLIHPLAHQDASNEVQRMGTKSAIPGFPRINLMDYKRGGITKIDITVLAPDSPAINENESAGGGCTARQYIKHVTRETLRHALKRLNPSTFDRPSTSQSEEEETTGAVVDDLPIPVEIHTSEATSHRSHVYILLVAHTSSGFRIGHDALGSLPKDPFDQGKKRGHKGKPKPQSHSRSRPEADTYGIKSLVSRCVDGFIEEISNEKPSADDTSPPRTEPCLDRHMRDQIIIFEELGKACHPKNEETNEILEDKRGWTLHTKTAEWVCRQMLGNG
jgi:RNA 3'-terminal phosphate cyclase (ATP)